MKQLLEAVNGALVETASEPLEIFDIYELPPDALLRGPKKSIKTDADVAQLRPGAELEVLLIPPEIQCRMHKRCQQP